MSGFRIEKLGEMCNFIGGSQPPKSSFVYDLSSVVETDYVRLIQIRDYKSDKHIVYIPKSSTKKFCTKDDVMIGRYGPPVFQILKGLEGAYNVALMKAVPKTKELDKDYLFRFLDSPEVQNYIIKLSERAAGQTGVNKQALHDYPIWVPAIPEQKRIVAILDQAFADIEQARAKTEQNLKNARELFESYLQQIFSQRGDGWIECPLGSICNFKHGFAFKSEYFTENSDLVLLTPGNFFEEGGYKDRGNKQKYYDGPFPKDFLLTKNSLLVAMTEQAVGLLGAPALVPDDDIFLHNQRLGLVELTSEFEGKVSMEFLFHLFNTKHFRSKVQETASGAKVRHTSPKKMQVITVSLPNDINEQSIIAQKLFCLKEKSLELEGFYSQKLLYLDELKKSILQKAFTGKLSKSNT
jgi:type I restriction enzyme S subunit